VSILKNSRNYVDISTRLGLGIISLVFMLPMLLQGNSSGIFVVLFIFILMTIFIYPLLALTNFLYTLKKPFNFITLILLVIFMIGLLLYDSSPVKQHFICKSESCRKSPTECINNRLGDGQVCVQIDNSELD